MRQLQPALVGFYGCRPQAIFYLFNGMIFSVIDYYFLANDCVLD